MSKSQPEEDSIQIDAKSAEAFDSKQKQQQKDVAVRTTSNHELSVRTCPVANVTVFIDRAEVNRNVELNLAHGDVEVLVKDIPSSADKDSIRVSCYGSATIVEVAFQEKAVKENDTDDEAARKTKTEAERDNLKEKSKQLTKDKERCNSRIDVVESEQKILNDYSKCISSQKEDKVAEVLEKKSIDNMLNFLAIYQDRSSKLTDELFELREKVEGIDHELEVVKANLEKLVPDSKKTKTERNVSILLDARASGHVKLILSYVVSNASWSPLYDVRAFNKDSSVQILYFAMIKQNTDEDWNDAKLSLSTAMPSVGGSAPALNRQELYFECVTLGLKSMDFSARKLMRRSRRSNRPNTLEYDCIIDDESINSSLDMAQSFPTAEATENITSTNFEIIRPATIQSDGVGHKVSICQLDFKPKFEYNAVPKTVAHAFLAIKVKNESTYALLAGNANVFLDNNFITKSSLPAVSPNEEFEMSLGVDPAVKVTYKPLKKFKQTTGMISKAAVFNYHQQIVVKNTKSVPVKITVTDQCPYSTNDKIKVTLQEPEMKLPKPSSSSEPSIVTKNNVTLYTSDYKMEWSCDIPASETKTINLRFQVEHPAGSCIKGI